MEKMVDKIEVGPIPIECIIGTLAREREKTQKIIVTLSLYADLMAAGKSDHLGDTVDYSLIESRVVALVKESDCFLIEGLADRIAVECLNEEKISSVRVRIEKPEALSFAKTVAVEIYRTKKS